MGKCRLISDLSEADAKISAFPEDESVDDDDSVDDDEIDDVDSSSHDRVPVQVESVPSDVIDTSHIQIDRGGGRMNRYNLRSKS